MGFRDQRIKAEMGVEEVADKVGVTRQAVYGWEKGMYYPSVNILQKLAQLYQCSIEELLEGEVVQHD